MNEAETRAEHIDPALKALAALLQAPFSPRDREQFANAVDRFLTRMQKR